MFKRKHDPNKIIAFIRDYSGKNGLAPTMQEIRDACGVSSTSVVSYNLTGLEKAGRIRRPRINGRVVGRQIEILDEPEF